MPPFRSLKAWQHAQRLAVECARAAKRFPEGEVESALELAKDLEYIDAPEYARLDAIATEAAKTLWGLLRKVGDTAMRHPTP